MKKFGTMSIYYISKFNSIERHTAMIHHTIMTKKKSVQQP